MEKGVGCEGSPFEGGTWLPHRIRDGLFSC